MAEFIRARSDEQKEQRLREIKTAADALFDEMPYHAITLTSIAERLGCSRAQVYKYAETKEEVFLELCGDGIDDYFKALTAAFPRGCGYSDEVFAEVWAGILNAHGKFLRYCAILMTIIETNVSVERLGVFKKRYYEGLDIITDMLSENLRLSKDDATALYETIYFQAVGISTYCYDNPLVREAMESVGLKENKPEFRAVMRDFILMCIRSRR